MVHTDGWPETRSSGSLALLTAVLIVLVNIPVTRYGVSLARILPETSSLIIRDGLVLKGSGPEIYMLENERLRWIKDIDTFEAEGLKWEDVRFVSCQYLRDLPTGPSIPEDAGPAPEP
ncbi:MAG: hypothetical protein ACK2UC_06820 [Anaerolineae bacterium]|jgi:hypothetical protein